MTLRFLYRQQWPVNLTLPAISGSAIVGQTLTRVVGTWAGNPTVLTYQWYRDGVAIGGATATTHVVVSGDLTHVITVRESANNAISPVIVATSAGTAPVTSALAAPVNTVLPVISGANPPLDGTTLTASTGTWTGNPTPTYAYQWKADGGSVGTNSSSYIVASADMGKIITVTVTATNSQGAVSATSNGTLAVTSVVHVWDPADMSQAPVFTITLDVQNTTVGAVTANTLSQPHAFNPAGSVFANTFDTSPSTSKRYLAASAVNSFSYRSKYFSRDHTWAGWVRNGYVYLRKTAAGKAWFLQWNAAGNGYSIGIVTGLTEGVSYPLSGTYTSLWGVSGLAAIQALVPGYTPTATQDYKLRFGCSGFDVTLEISLNGTDYTVVHALTRAEGKWFHMEPGCVALAANAGYGHRTFTIDYDDTPVSLLSDTSAGIYDLTDFGVKYLATTGTISAASTSLTLASDAATLGFAVGDKIIIEIGAEPGAGALGTNGVGGAWPTLFYANAAAMNADTTKPSQTLCWLVDTGFTYQFNTGYVPGGWAKLDTYTPQQTYSLKAVPKAHTSTITAIAGSVLTLATASKAGATNANVYFDNEPIINDFGLNSYASLLPTNPTIRLPNVRLPIFKRLSWNARPGWTILGKGSGIEYADTVYGTTGETTIWAPDGAPSAGWQVIFSNGIGFKHFHIDGNAYNTKFGMNWNTISETNALGDYPGGLVFTSCSNCVIENIKTTQVWQKAISFAFSTGSVVRNCVSVKTDPMLRYIQWEFDSSDGAVNQFIDCECIYSWFSPGFEPWLDNGSSFIRCVGDNVLSSSNGAGNVLYEDYRSLIRANSRYSDNSESLGNPILNINTNAGPSGDGIIRDMAVLYEGYYDAAGNQPKAIVVNSNCNGWDILNSVFEMLPYVSTNPTYGAIAVDVQGNSAVIDGCRVVGTTIAPWAGNLNAYAGTGTVISNSIADAIANTQVGGTGAVGTNGNVNNATVGFDRAPTAVSFTPVTDAVAGEYYTSNTVNIAGVNALLQNCNISANGQMIWNGSGLLRGRDHFMFKLIKNGDTIAVRALAHADAGGVTTVTLTLNGVGYNFVVTTASAAPSALPGSPQAVWFADQYNATGSRKYIPNLEAADADAPQHLNQWRQFKTATQFTGFGHTNMTLTQGRTDSVGGTDATRFVGTGTWATQNAFGVTLGAGAHTTVIKVKSNTGIAQEILADVSGVGAGTVITVPATGWSRIPFSETLTGSSSRVMIRMRKSPTGGNLDIDLEMWECFAGAVDPGEVANDGHMVLGTNYLTQEPTVAANEVSIDEASKLGTVLFDANQSLASFTLFATCRKTIADPGLTTAIMTSAFNNQFGELALYSGYYEAAVMTFSTPNYSPLGYLQAYSPGGARKLFDPLNNGYNVWWMRYDAATSYAWIGLNDSLIAGQSIAKTAITNFRGMFLNENGVRSSMKWTSGAFYNSALSKANIDSTVAVLKARVLVNGLTLDTTQNFIFALGDSNTCNSQESGVAPGDQAYFHQYKPNASAPVYIFNHAFNGAKLSHMIARLPLITPAIPTTPGSRKYFATCMIGTNDMTDTLTSSAATYAANMKTNLFGVLKTAGFTTVYIEMLDRTDVNAAIGHAAWVAAVNSAMFAAVGTEVDLYVAQPAVNLDPNNTTYFKTDKVHLMNAGQAALEVNVRAVMNAAL